MKTLPSVIFYRVLNTKESYESIRKVKAHGQVEDGLIKYDPAGAVVLSGDPAEGGITKQSGAIVNSPAKCAENPEHPLHGDDLVNNGVQLSSQVPTPEKVAVQGDIDDHLHDQDRVDGVPADEERELCAQLLPHCWIKVSIFCKFWRREIHQAKNQTNKQEKEQDDGADVRDPGVAAIGNLDDWPHDVDHGDEETNKKYDHECRHTILDNMQGLYLHNDNYYTTSSLTESRLGYHLYPSKDTVLKIIWNPLVD